jgi:hypothetical protein
MRAEHQSDVNAPNAPTPTKTLEPMLKKRNDVQYRVDDCAREVEIIVIRNAVAPKSRVSRCRKRRAADIA